MFQYPADFEKQRHGEPLGAEGLVDVFGGAVHLFCQPYGCAALAHQLLLQQPPEVQIRFWYQFFHVYRLVCIMKSAARSRTAGQK